MLTGFSHRTEAALVSAVRVFWEEAAGTSAFGSEALSSENKHKSQHCIYNNHNHTPKLTAYSILKNIYRLLQFQGYQMRKSS